jgi:hypothetical protein
MTFYIPASFDDANYAPSWTGNYTYPTVTIRGIFNSMEKATRALEGWNFADTCNILERNIDDDNLPDNPVFSIDYYGDYGLAIWWSDKYGSYGLNEIVDEAYSAVYDKNGDLGVTDY